jgi:hypothetical protein
MNGNSYSLVQAVRGPIMLIALGTLVAMDYFNVDGFTFGRTWPILIIIFGAMKLLEKILVRPVYPDNRPPGGNAI